jgi:RNA polymerase sigma factor (sigma-70 family)
VDQETASADESLWANARSGDAVARERIAGLAREIAARELRARRARPADVDDLVQEAVRSTLAFLEARGEAPKELRAFLKFRAWGVLSDHRKRRRRHPMETRTHEDLDRPAQGPSPAATASALQVKDALDDCRTRLSPEQRAVLSLRYDEHLETDAIVARTGANRSTVHVRVFRALQSLRECLGRKGFDAGDLTS